MNPAQKILLAIAAGIILTTCYFTIGQNGRYQAANIPGAAIIVVMDTRTGAMTGYTVNPSKSGYYFERIVD